MSSAARIVLLRHGQTDYNVQARFQGASDFPLNVTGRRQADRAAAVLAQRLTARANSVGLWADGGGSGGVRVVTSPLIRARETAGRVARALLEAGALLEGEDGAEVFVDQRLKERAYGLFEGRTRDDIRNDLPEAFAEWSETGESAAAGIEDSVVVGRRVAEALLDHAHQATAGQTVVAVAHGSAITRGLLTVLGLDPATFQGMRGLDNCHWSELVPDQRHGVWRLAAHNLGATEDRIGA